MMGVWVATNSKNKTVVVLHTFSRWFTCYSIIIYYSDHRAKAAPQPCMTICEGGWWKNVCRKEAFRKVFVDYLHINRNGSLLVAQLLVSFLASLMNAHSFFYGDSNCIIEPITIHLSDL